MADSWPSTKDFMGAISARVGISSSSAMDWNHSSYMVMITGNAGRNYAIGQMIARTAVCVMMISKSDDDTDLEN